MKVLYIGHYKEGTGWSAAAINNIMALKTLDIDLVTRNARLTRDVEVPNEILELEKKDLQDVDVCIQHVLPHHLVGTNKFKKNIAYFAGETNTIKFCSNWLPSIQMKDEVWVPCMKGYSALKSDGIENVKLVPHTFDTSIYGQSQELSFNGIIKDNFKFYYVGDINDRKNLDNIIRCFHVAFSPSEPVDLILKVGSPAGEQATMQIVNDKSQKIKQELKMYNDLSCYKKENIISRNLSRKELIQLHLICDCYLSPSHGEAWNIPAFEAMAFGNTPICSDDGGPSDFIDPREPNTGTLIKGINRICNHQSAAFPFLGTGREMWFEPDDAETIKAMRYYFENRNKKDKTKGLSRAERFDYSKVSQIMLENMK